jgi:hypothetical protein
MDDAGDSLFGDSEGLFVGASNLPDRDRQGIGEGSTVSWARGRASPLPYPAAA